VYALAGFLQERGREPKTKGWGASFKQQTWLAPPRSINSSAPQKAQSKDSHVTGFIKKREDFYKALVVILSFGKVQQQTSK